MFNQRFLLIVSLLIPFILIAPAAADDAKAAPVIDKFYVEQVESLDPDTDLMFILEGTSGSTAKLRISGVARTIPMQEVEPGVYEGSYTIKRTDKLKANARVSATLEKRGLLITRRLGQSLTPDPVAPAPRPQTGGLSIERFTVQAVDRIEPGADLNLTLNGTPRAKATFTIEGVVTNALMTETSAGVYAGTYTIRQRDNFPPGLKITATLSPHVQSVSATLKQPLVKDADAPVIKNLTPRDDETVSLGSRIFISGSFDDGAGSGVDPNAVRVLFDGRDVTDSAVITASFFSYQPEAPLSIKEYKVEVSAKDLAGNAMRMQWKFKVQRGEVKPDTKAALPLEILSPANNSQVSGSGAVEVKGRSAPNVDVSVNVEALASLAGIIGMNQNIFNRTVRSDAKGNFTFTFEPRYVVPGTRYEVKLSVGEGDQKREQTLVLHTQK